MNFYLKEAKNLPYNPLNRPYNMPDCPLDCDFSQNRTRQHICQHIRQGIPTHLSYADINLIPKRQDFTQKDLFALFGKQIAAGKPIIFLPNAVTEAHEYVKVRNTDGDMMSVQKYIIYIFGILPCGSKTALIIENVPVHYDIMVPRVVPLINPDGTYQPITAVQKRRATNEFESLMRTLAIDNKLNYEKLEVVKQYHHHGFQKEKSDYLRFHFNNLTDRKKVIEYISATNKIKKQRGDVLYETAADDYSGQDTTYYFAKYAREQQFATADWNKVTDYTVSTGTTCQYTLRVNYDKITKLRAEDRRRHESGPIGKTIERDPLMHCVWDIETQCTKGDGQVPNENDDYLIFMMCSAYFWHHSTIPLCTVNVVCLESAPSVKGAEVQIDITIQCKTEKELIQAHMKVLGALQPDITTAFNGGHFDWPLYREKCRRFDLLVELKRNLSALPVRTGGNWPDNSANILRFNFKKEKIKIDAESSHELKCVAVFPGLIDTDALPVFLKLYTRMEVRKAASLNFFLERNKLAGKKDMPYKRMFKIVERSQKLQKCSRECHCYGGISMRSDTPPSTLNGTMDQSTCPVCVEIVPEIDCPSVENNLETEYSNIPYEFTKKCCACGKRPQNLIDVRETGEYCVVDCIRPHQLYVKRAIIPDKRELSTLSYVAVIDSFFRADGMKVCNLIGAYSYKRQMAFSNARSLKTDSEKDHFPGAHVFNPQVGLHDDSPITGLDFSSLYPSLMRAWNLSADTVVYTKAEADALAAEGYSIYHIQPFNYERGEKRGVVGNRHLVGEGWTVRHNGILKKTDTHIIDHYEKVTDESGRTSYKPVYGREALPGERIGIFAFIVNKLFDKRVPVKKEFVKYSKILEYMELHHMHEYNVGTEDKPQMMSISDVEFQIAKINSKQLAIKVLANTFYGKSGDYRAAIYELLVAAGITCAGQQAIKLVAGFVEERHFTVTYGDTDSLYLKCPPHHFAEFKAEYEATLAELAEKYRLADGTPRIIHTKITEESTQEDIDYKKDRAVARVKYWTSMVATAMKVMNNLRDDVFEMLIKYCNTLFMSMAYEEVGMPTVLTGKKKYFMTPHIEVINFYPKDIFIRGIDIIKQGQTKINKMLGDEFMREVLSPENERSLIDVCHDMIRKFYKLSDNPDPALFVLAGRYKPDKKNVAVHIFHERMTETYKTIRDPILKPLYEPPEAGDKFMYVIVERPQDYTERGNIIKLTKGHQMEYLRVYQASQSTNNPMKLDLSYYMMHGAVGIFARFIASLPQFAPAAGQFDLTDKEQYKKMDKWCVDQASKYLTDMCYKISGVDRDSVKTGGLFAKNIYRQTRAVLSDRMIDRLGMNMWFIENIERPEDPKAEWPSDYTIRQINNEAQRMARDMCDKHTPVQQYIKNIQERPEIARISLIRLRQMTAKNNIIREKYLHECETKIQREIKQISFKVNEIMKKHTQSVANLITDLRCNFSDETDPKSHVHIPEERLETAMIDEESANVLANARRLMIKLAVIMQSRETYKERLRYLTDEREKMTGEINIPFENKFVEAKEDAKKMADVGEYEWK